MNAMLSPRSASILRALARRGAKALAPAAGFVILMAGSAALLGLSLAALVFAGLLMAGPWIGGVQELPLSDLMRGWVSGLLIAALLAWAIRDASRAPALIALASFKRPFKSALVIAGSGLFILMDRLRQWGGGAGWGPQWTRPMELSAPEPTDPAILKASPWRAAAEPIALALRGLEKSARLTPLACATLLWGVPSALMAFAILPFAGLEAFVFWLIGQAGGFLKTPLSERVSGALSALADEGAPDLAARERSDLERQAGPGSAKAPAGARKGL